MSKLFKFEQFEVLESKYLTRQKQIHGMIKFLFVIDFNRKLLKHKEQQNIKHH